MMSILMYILQQIALTSITSAILWYQDVELILDSLKLLDRSPEILTVVSIQLLETPQEPPLCFACLPSGPSMAQTLSSPVAGPAVDLTNWK